MAGDQERALARLAGVVEAGQQFGPDQVDRRLQQEGVAVAEVLVDQLSAHVRGLGDLGQWHGGRTVCGHEVDGGLQEGGTGAPHPAVFGGCVG